jgi:hypothetical protein
MKNLVKVCLERDEQLLRKCRESYEGLADFRLRRNRCKDFAYGRQWGDTYRMPSGRVVSEEENILENGRIPITNNMIRRLIRSVVGKYRYLTQRSREDGIDEALQSSIGSKADADARTLEEFLISGCALQRVYRNEQGEWSVINVSPDRLFFDNFESGDASDCRFIGMLHDMTIGDLLRRFAGGDAQRTEQLTDLFFRIKEKESVACRSFGERTRVIDFCDSGSDDTIRVIEVWRKVNMRIIRCHDTSTGDYTECEWSERGLRTLKRENRRRMRAGKDVIRYSVGVVEYRQHSWLTSDGILLCRDNYGVDVKPQLVLTLYPMIDGEIHSLVEDVIGQQKYVNRLITLLDDVVSSAAKGVVLYPADQLPDGMTWKDLRKLWSMPGGVIPFKRTSKNIMPRQVNTSGSMEGASELLKIQLQMFDEISGTTDVPRNTSGNNGGVEMLRQQMENSTLSLLDILATFRHFTTMRDEIIQQSGNY